MKAVAHTAYGPPEELQVREVDKPVPEDNEVLIKIHATTVSTSDCNLRNLTFTPKLFVLPMRLQFGISKPKDSKLGLELAGEVEAIGKDVSRFNAGDQVFGTTEPAYGAYAQFICLPDDAVLTTKPTSMTYEEAATLPNIGNTALHFIRDLGNIQAGQKILINGASGGIGTFAVQIAKYYGAEVTGICGPTNVEMVKSLGADRVIDYIKVDFTQSSETYDVIFDAVGKSSFSRCKGVLKENGLYLDTVPKVSTLLQMMLTSSMGSKKAKLGNAVPSIENLEFLKGLIETGKLKTVIDRRYPLEQIVEAFQYVERGHKKGNVVITVEHNE